MEKTHDVESSMVPGLLENEEQKLVGVRCRYERAMQYLAAHGKKSVLDLGCSAGYGSSLMSSRGFRVCGIDRNRKSIELAKKRYPGIDFRAADGGSVMKKKYDAVVALDVIEHMDNHRETIEKWLGMLGPGGLLIISTPNFKYSKCRNRFHKKEFTIGEIREMFPGAVVEGFDWHYMTTKPVTMFFGGAAATRFRMFFNCLARRLPSFSNTFFIVARKP